MRKKRIQQIWQLEISAFHEIGLVYDEERSPEELLWGYLSSTYIGDNSVYENSDYNKFYLKGKKVNASEFYETLYGYYDAGNSVCASGTAFYPFSEGYNFESSFNQVLREISDAKPTSNLELMAFYMESWDKNTNEDTGGSAPGKILTEADVVLTLLVSPVEDWKIRLKCAGAIRFGDDDEDSLSSESRKCHAFSSDGKILKQDDGGFDLFENQEIVESTVCQVNKYGMFEEVTSLMYDRLDYDSGEVKSIYCKKDDNGCTYTEYLGEYAKYIDSVGWFDFCSLSASGNLKEYKKAVDGWKGNIEVDFEEDDGYACIDCDYRKRKAYPEVYEAFDAYMKFTVESDEIRGTFLYLDDDIYPEFVCLDTLYTYKDGTVLRSCRKLQIWTSCLQS